MAELHVFPHPDHPCVDPRSHRRCLAWAKLIEWCDEQDAKMRPVTWICRHSCRGPTGAAPVFRERTLKVA